MTDTMGNGTTMGEVNHSHRDDPRNVFGELFRRGASTTTDGGRRTAEEDAEADTESETEADTESETEADTESETDRERMADVAHETSDETDANDVWTRGRTVGSPDR